VVIALAQPTRITRLAFDNEVPVEAGFEGVAAKRFRVEASALGPERGYRQIAAGELVSGKSDQAFSADSGGPVRWLRLTILSNHGHPTLTELMELRAFGDSAGQEAGAQPGESFRLERARTSREKNGPQLPEGQAFRETERVWVNFKPRALATNAEGKYWIEVDLILEDDQGNALLRRDKVVDRLARHPSPPLSTFVAVHLDLPEAFPAGTYTVRLIARDRFGEQSAAATCTFRVTETE
jgi:hypothetical protein